MKSSRFAPFLSCFDATLKFHYGAGNARNCRLFNHLSVVSCLCGMGRTISRLVVRQYSLCSSECSPNLIATALLTRMSSSKSVEMSSYLPDLARFVFFNLGRTIVDFRLFGKCLLPDSSAHVTNLFLFPLPPPPRLPHYPPHLSHLTSFEVKNISYLTSRLHNIYKRELFEHRTYEHTI